MPKRTKREASGPSFGERLGLDYKRWTLDCIVTIAHAVSLDFSDRLELYQNVEDGTASKLAELQGSYGFQPNLPAEPVRNRLMKSIFGESDGLGGGKDGSPFQVYRLPVLAAATDFAENAQPTAFPMLRERVRSAIVPFKTQMSDLGGASLAQTESRMSSVFDTSQFILKDPAISGVFGISGNVDPTWPLGSTDAQGAKLIEQICAQLPGLPCGGISREAFVRMQRIAEKGSQSIRIILDSVIDGATFDIDQLISELYAWASDLGLLGSARPQASGASTSVSASAAAAPAPSMTRLRASSGLSRPKAVYSR